MQNGSRRQFENDNTGNHMAMQPFDEKMFAHR
jgi:hypothetical protein